MTNEEKTQTMENVEVPEEEKSEKKALPWWKNRRAQYGLIAGACALVIAGGAGIAIASNQQATSGVQNMSYDNANAGTDARNSKTDEEKQQAQDAAKQETASKQEATTPQNSNSANNANSGSNSGNSGSASHTHSWTPVYKTVHHDAVTHEEPVYQYQDKYVGVFCTKHQCEITGRFCTQGNDYGTGYCMASNYNKYEKVKVQTGSKLVTDKAAYDENVVDHYNCSCGATK